MEFLPRPLYGSASSVSQSENSASNSAKLFLSELDPALLPFETYAHGYDFLESLQDSPRYDQTRTTVERLILWALLIRKKSLLDLNKADAFEFVWFIQEPLVEWQCDRGTLRYMKVVSASGVRSVIPNPKWRPFTEERLPQEAPTLRKVMNICSAMYTHLVRGGFTLRNPFSELLTQNSNPEVPPSSSENLIAVEHWGKIFQGAKRLAAANPPMHERTLFVVASIVYLDISLSDCFDSAGEVLKLGNFTRDGDSWRLNLDSGVIPVSQCFVTQHLLRFCRFSGLNFESDGEKPAIPRVAGFGQVTRRTLAKITKDAVREALRQMERDGASKEKIQDLEDFYHAWAYSSVQRPRANIAPESDSSTSQSNSLLAPLFADYREIVQSDSVVSDHPEVILYLTSCDSAAKPLEVFRHAKEYLYRFRNKNTYDTYRKCIERFLLWAFVVKKKPVYSLVEIDLPAFGEFCRTPPSTWVRNSYQCRFLRAIAGSKSRGSTLTVINHDWRPFWAAGVLVESSVAVPYHASNETLAGQFSIVRSFYDFLLSIGVASQNPLINRDSFALYSHSRRKTTRAHQGARESIFDKVVDYCIYSMRSEHLYRILFVVYTINELKLSRAQIRAAGGLLGFHCFHKVVGSEWVAEVPSVNGKPKRIFVSQSYMENVLNPYRDYLKRKYKSFSNNCPLFLANLGEASLSHYQVSNILQEVFKCAAEKMQFDREAPLAVEAMRKFTIGALAKSPRPTMYLLKQALP